ncbi:uncharacterized protein PV07_12771 [Cladophialophora immunda]|uniref:Uncharacterized protein n=1 Tax=Cladophialophora immunda TaxID=569365 RepID=A0A0D2CE08_9EURO|nr:uncharacterized protein PV07_12771 [Cladophialophora immunda]KIW21804.1 hypothetical protein PV07_12771 [Cladophialophora immunda]
MDQPQSTKEIWEHLNLVTEKELMVKPWKSHEENAKSLVVEDAEAKDKTKMMNRLLAGNVKPTISEQFTLGILTLIPIPTADGPNNIA